MGQFHLKVCRKEERLSQTVNMLVKGKYVLKTGSNMQCNGMAARGKSDSFLILNGAAVNDKTDAHSIYVFLNGAAIVNYGTLTHLAFMCFWMEEYFDN